MGAHSHVEQQQLQLLRGQQPLLRLVAHLLCQKSPLAGAEVVRQTPAHVSVAPVGAGAMVHFHPGPTGKHREMDQGGHWHMMLSVTLHICSSRDGVCWSSSSGPQGINFCYDLHHPYDCSTFLFTLNCLQIKTKDKIIMKKKIRFCPLGLFTQLCGTAPSMLAGPRHIWVYNKKSSWRSFLWAELSMSPLSRRELLILHLDSNFNNTFLYKHNRITDFFQHSCNNKQVIPPFPCQIFFLILYSFFWAI